MENLESKFSFIQCWTCRNLVYDIAINKHRCPHRGIVIEQPYNPTDCKDWTRS